MRKLREYLLLDVRIQNKLLIANIVLVLLAAIITVSIFYTRFYRQAVTLTLDRQTALVKQADLALEEQIRDIEQISNAICTDRTLRSVLSLETPASVTELAAVNAVFGSYETRQDIYAVRIYCDTDGWYFLPKSELENKYWKGLMDVSGASRAVFPSHYLSGIGFERELMMSARSPTAAYVQIMSYAAGDAWKTAYAVVYFSQERIGELLRTPISLEDESAYIIDSKNQVVAYSQTEISSGYLLDYEELADLFSGGGDYATLSYNGANTYVSYSDIAGTDWRLVWLIPERGVIRQARLLLYDSVGTYLVLLLLAFGLSILISRSISRRIKTLQEQMDSARGEDPVMIEGKLGRDEIGRVMASYNDMARRIDELMNQKLEMVEQLSDTEIHILRAQIDPHFLYNTLGMIKMMINSGRTEDAQEAIDELSTYYRRSLNNGRIQCLVSDELEHVTMYMNIINRRWSGRIDFMTDLPDEMMDFEMPVCVFQPIVENSITHGIFEKPSREGSIQIMGWMDKDYLYFQISDDGVGMSEEQMEALRHKNEEPERSGIGVYNTDQRLKIIYGREDVGLDFHSVQGEGTDVTIRIPKRRRTEDEV